MHDHLYREGPSVCVAHPKVVKNIRKTIAQQRLLSLHEVRVARHMGLLATTPTIRLGFNDGIIYPFDEPRPATALLAGPRRLSALAAPAKKKRKMHALALLVDFADNKGTRPASAFRKLLFQKSNAGSMTSFYKKLSYGALELTGEVIGYIRAPQPYSFYTAGESGTGMDFPRNTPGLLRDVLTIFCQSDNLKRFDSDGDGFVDGIFLIHAGPGAETESSPAKRKEMIWSHKWVLPRAFVNQGVKVFAYSTEPEDGKLGVFSHEFGHSLGLPDLYDTSYRSAGVGSWCLMGGGSWGGGGDQPTRMSCWCLSTLGWIKPRTVKRKRKVTLRSLEKRKDQCLRVWTGGATGPEYFLLENRQDTGRDQALPGPGLAIWHIDEQQSDNTNPLAYRVGLVQADGKRDLEFDRNSGDASDVFPGRNGVAAIDDQTTPSLRDHSGRATGVKVADIADAPGGKITAEISV